VADAGRATSCCGCANTGRISTAVSAIRLELHAELLVDVAPGRAAGLMLAARHRAVAPNGVGLACGPRAIEPDVGVLSATLRGVHE
jgi:hypothetical protein